LSLLVASLWFASLFNPIANLHFFADHSGTMQMELSGLVKEKYEDAYLKVDRVKLRRDGESFPKKVLDLFNPPRLYLITFKKNHNNFAISYQPDGQSSRDNIGDKALFSVNSSFYDPQMNSLGEIVVDGQNFGVASGSSGYFKVIDGKAHAGPRSLFEGINGPVEFSCQAHPSVMKNGLIWPYVVNETLNKKTWSRKTLRNMSGIDKNGNIVFLLSGDGGLLSVKEISLLAKELGVETATLFDAGSALQYSINARGYKMNFSAFNNQLNLGERADRYFKKLTGYRFYNTSPVFINYKAQ